MSITCRRVSLYTGEDSVPWFILDVVTSCMVIVNHPCDLWPKIKALVKTWVMDDLLYWPQFIGTMIFSRVVFYLKYIWTRLELGKCCGLEFQRFETEGKPPTRIFIYNSGSSEGQGGHDSPGPVKISHKKDININFANVILAIFSQCNRRWTSPKC